MPLFGSKHHEEYPTPANAPPPPPPAPEADSGHRKGGLFSRRNRSTSPDNTETNGYNNGHANGAGYNGRAANGPYHNGYDDGYDNINTNAATGGRRRGFFGGGRHSNSSDDSDSYRSAPGRNGSVRSAGTGMSGNRLHNSNRSRDPAIIGAKQKVGAAEEAEREADRALVGARAAVREARQEVKDLEQRMEEE